MMPCPPGKATEKFAKLSVRVVTKYLWYPCPLKLFDHSKTLIIPDLCFEILQSSVNNCITD